MDNLPKKISIPSELRISQKWDYAIEQFLVRATIGGITAGLASFVLFGTRCPRLAFTTFGVGFGAGDAFRLSSIAFEKEKSSSVAIEKK